MACSLSVFSCIQDVNRVIQLLSESGPSSEKEASHSEDDAKEEGWDIDSEDWGWTADEAESNKPGLSSLWLQDCCISLSPSNDTMVIARDDRAVFLTSKWDSQTETQPRTKYEIMWSGSLAVEEGECVTDVLCIPLASQHRSSQGSPDWTCIIAGMTSGYMRIYLQNGSLMFSQLLHEDPVIRLKCRTWQPHRSYGKLEQVEELAILYPNALVIIDGFSMYQSLRACRNQLARAQASGTQDLVQPPPLAYKKWRFDGQRIITDIASCGIVTQNLFDQLQTASFIGGYNAVIRTAAPAMSHYVTSGADPFMAVYCAIEGSSPPLISDVAMAVASKLTSAVLSKLSAASGWLGWGGKAEPTETTKPKKPKVEKGTKLPARYGLPDFRRHGNSITLAPNGKVAVTTDEFGRVLLLDIKKGIAIRMWKGYRDAECGWIMVDEDDVTTDDSSTHAHHSHRTALFLVIYAAKRGILEIWRAEQGPRVAAFNIGKDCRLLYAGHGIMGLSHVIRQGQAPPQHTLNCTLILGDGTLKTISVPFHYALSDKHSRRIRDLHLLKKLIALLDSVKSGDSEDNRVVDKVEVPAVDILTDIQTPQLQRQGLQCLLGTVGLPGSVMIKAVKAVSESFHEQGMSPSNEEDEEKEDTDSLLRFCATQTRLLQAYSSLINLTDGDENESPSNTKNTQLAIAQLLGITKTEAVELLDSLENYWQHKPTQPKSKKAKDSHNRPLTVTAFLSCFEPALQKSSRRSSDGTEASGSGIVNEQAVCVRKGISTDMRMQLANVLYKRCLTGSCAAESLSLPLDSSGIKPTHLMDLLVQLWLDTSDVFPDTVEVMFALHSLVSTISAMSGGVFGDDTEGDDSTVSQWWERVRHALAQSTSVARALTLAVVCRSVSLGMSTAAKKVQNEDAEQNSRELAVGDWVSISVEIERWNLLVFQLSDLVMLRVFIVRLPETLQLEPVSIADSSALSVLGLLSGGHGAAARVLARSLVRYGVLPRLLGEPRRLATTNVESPEGEGAEDDDTPEEEAEEISDENRLQGLNELRTRFPHSLHQDILWATCVDECAVQWSADKEQTGKLVSALEHLRCIHCIGLQHGLAVLLWKKYLKDKISSMVVLMEKVGKAPKDRLCRKTVDMSYAALEELLYVVKQLLKLIAQIDMSEAEVLVLRTEDFWHAGSGGTPQSIIEEAIEQTSSNVPLVEHHAILVTIMWLIIGLEMKSVKPLTLFDTTSKGAFLKDLSSSIVLLSGPTGESISQARSKFLNRAVSMLVSSMSSPQTTDSSSAHHTNTPDDWSLAIFRLAEQLGIEVDPLRRHYVCELFSGGLDSTGMEILMSVQDKETLGACLLSIVGQRLAYALNSTESSTESVTQLSRLPTNISRWIKQQEPSKLVRRIVPLSLTGALLTTILTLLPCDSADFSLASELSESAEFLFRQT